MNATKTAALAALLAVGALIALSSPALHRPARILAQGRPQEAPRRGDEPDRERRLREVERTLDRLVTEWDQVRPSAALGRPGPEPSPWDEEGRRKAAIWARLTRDGFIGRYDCEEIPPPRLAIALYRRYLGRRPTAEEMAEWLESYGPGAEQIRLAPEVIVRRMLGPEGAPTSPLEMAILRAADPGRAGSTPGPQAPR